MRFLLWLLPSLLAAQTYDIVLQSGRVMDPESGLDAVRSVGIIGSKIAAVSSRPLRGRTEVDASRLVIAPGFIDLHQHSQTPEAYGFKAMDGVTTALELEVGASPVSEWYAVREGKSVINFGASSGHIPARMAVMHDTGGLLPRDAATKPATPEEQKAISAAVQKGLDEGGLGMGMGIVYTPTATPDEILDLFHLAAKFKRPVFVHMRSTGNVISSLQEVITDAAASGAPLHIVHINSSSGAKTAQALRLIEGVRARGLDVTTEAYPYTAGMTEIASANYSGLENRPPEFFATMLWPPTGERLTRESFERYRRQGGFVAQFNNTEDMVRLAISNPMVMIASDGISEHPRSAGTYSRVLGKYVREEKALTLMNAIRKSSLLPAQRLAAMSSQMRQKGRIKPGADADLSVFDPDSVIDKSTFEKPAQYSEGFRYVLVNGTFVVRDGKLQSGVFPGQGIRAR
jgi:N-acyl-D-aspartate/D-glutamate deacylase